MSYYSFTGRAQSPLELPSIRILSWNQGDGVARQLFKLGSILGYYHRSLLQVLELLDLGLLNRGRKVLIQEKSFKLHKCQGGNILYSFNQFPPMVGFSLHLVGSKSHTVLIPIDPQGVKDNLYLLKPGFCYNQFRFTVKDRGSSFAELTHCLSPGHGSRCLHIRLGSVSIQGSYECLHQLSDIRVTRSVVSPVRRSFPTILITVSIPRSHHL